MGRRTGLYSGGSAGVRFSGSWARRTQEAIYKAYLSQAGHVAIIDYHTGLGPWGYGEQIISDLVGSPGCDRARRWYGAVATSPSSGTSTSADIVGDGLAAAPILLAHAEVTGMALEVGTQETMTVLNALRADAWLHAYGDPTSDQGKAIKAQIRDAFYGDADDWKGMVAGQSLLAVKQTLAGLAG